MVSKKAKKLKPSKLPIIYITVYIGIFLVLFAYLQPKTVPSNLIQLDGTFNVTPATITNTQSNASQIYGIYLALNSSQRAIGYSNQSTVGDCGGKFPCIGMLFVYNQVNSTGPCLSTTNVPLALKESWIDQTGTVIYSYDAQPHSSKTVCHEGVAVLQTQQNQSISVGSKVNLLFYQNLIND